MTEYRTVWAGTAAVVAVAAAMIAGIRSLPELITPIKTPPQQMQAAADPGALREAAEAAVQDAEDTAYLIRLDGDLLRIYREGSRTPEGEYALPAGWLPDYDRILLEYGMRVNNAQELRQVLEDYIS